MGSETPNDTVAIVGSPRRPLVVTEIQEELEIPNSTVSHHLEKLRGEGLVVRRLTRCARS
jgi:DNA-binding transcriptional regulator GbsR (MarR family)